MKKRFGKRVAALLMAMLMVIGLLPTGLFGVEDVKAADTVYTFDATTLTPRGDKVAFSAGTTFGNGYFKVFGDTVVERNSDDGTKVKSIEVGKSEKSGLEFTVSGSATVKMSVASTGGSNESAPAIIDANGNAVANNENIVTVTTTAKTDISYNLSAGTYKIVAKTGVKEGTDSSGNVKDLSAIRGFRIFTIEVRQSSSGAITPRKDWSSVAAPVLGTPSVADGKITVPFTMSIGYDGADKVSVAMKDASGAVVSTQDYATSSENGSVVFKPTKSGNFTFEITASRANETDKKGTPSSAVSYTLPLATPVIKSVTSAGGGKVSVAWEAVAEATAYEVYYKPASAADSAYKKGASVGASATEASVSGLTVGSEYTIKLVAVRGAENSSATQKVTATADAKRVWSFAAFGDGATAAKNTFTGDLNSAEGKVTLISSNNGGKLVPNSTDGLAFYYTKLDANNDNFVLEAKVTVNSWTYTNGQDGFGLMVCDSVAEHGNSASFWNNSIMNSVTKVEYFWDDENNKISTQGAKISMKLGVGAQSKTGVPAGHTTATMPSTFKSVMNPLDLSCAGVSGGTFNIIGNYTNTELAFTDTVKNNIKVLNLKIIRNNTGYTCVYSTEAGIEVGKYTYYDQDRNDLNQIDSQNIYVGFFTARSANVTFSDVKLTVTNSATDAPAEETPMETIDPLYTTSQTTDIGVPDYEFTFVSNCEGNLTVKDVNGAEVINAALKEVKDTRTNNVIISHKQMIKLNLGENKYTITFTPDPEYKPEEFVKMSTYEAQTWTYTVTYKKLGEPGQSIYVAANGWDKGKGTKDDPLTLREAIKYVQPGQTIVLMEGQYNVTNALTVQRGIDGTAENMIYLVADPEATSRPVLDFGGTSTGIVIAGDYWYLKGFDVTNSKNGQKGLQISGSNCVVEQVNAYKNGNTGIQISRFLSTDLWEDWPSNNLILNCTSYLNLDSGYEDADGFAAKLTIADGNVFRGCVAYNNADDGWDLFAKVETGPIGKVVIDNCIAYNNGYLTNGDPAGNGNGFKMGGSSIAGDHELKNSIAFGNRAKGIDSNSGPNIIVENCTSFNNHSYNVAFYTNNATNTDYSAKGIISYKNAAVGEEALAIYEQIKLKGTQDEAKVYNDTNYYYSAQAAAQEDWFVSTDVSKLNITRDADGSINTNGFLQLTDKAPANAGARLAATPSGVTIVIPPSVTGGIEEAPVATPTAPTKKDGGNKTGLYVAIGILVAVIIGSVVAVVVMKKKNAQAAGTDADNNSDLN